MLDSIAPHWKTELQMASIPITTFAALTMGCIDEIIINSNEYLSETGIITVGLLYQRRLKVIENNLKEHKFPGKYNLRTTSYCKLKEAAQWVYDQGWEIPEPMLKLVKEGKKENDVLLHESPQSKFRKAHAFESEGMNALYDLIEKYYLDTEGNPVDPEKWPAKKSLESEWLKGRTLMEADTIITGAKRAGKRKK
ncbi:MAG: hypothetical protein H0X43_10715 [Nitrosospira sp.]|nr:hypothetical protein [Nitrosospira sp.]